jgi:D-serine dehydratase
MENEPSKLKNFIPLDKSWIIRMGVLDLINKYPDALDFLEGQKNLSDDLVVLKRICRDWADKENIDVGESGTLYRFLGLMELFLWFFLLKKQIKY